jgi:hypothetical protein
MVIFHNMWYAMKTSLNYLRLNQFANKMDVEINTYIKHTTWKKRICISKGLWQMILPFTHSEKASKQN